MPSDLFEIILESSKWSSSGKVDPMMALARSMYVPKNSGIQVVYPKLIQVMQRARRLRPPFREEAIMKAQQMIAGIAAISSENGVMVRELNTTRDMRRDGLDTNVGQPATDLDKFFHRDLNLKNNPKSNASDIEL